MEQSRLLKIIQKDVSELFELTEELTEKEQPSKLEIEIAFSKSKLIFQEFELLKENMSSTPKESKIQEIVRNNGDSSILNKEQVIPEIDEKEDDHSEPAKTKDEEPVVEEIEQIEEVPQVHESELESEFEPEPKSVAEKESIQEIEKQEDIEEEQVEVENNDTDEEEETEDEESAKVVGEKFMKGKSLNDLMSENQTLDQKFASSHIEKLESAIGLNDRFLYIRELFNGNADHFRETIGKLDQMTDLKEAVDYLGGNFKWKKNDTSLKFVQLVKRRFTS